MPLGRVQQVLRDLVGVRLGRGTLVRWITGVGDAGAGGGAADGGAAPGAGAAQRRDGGASGWEAGVGARGQHADADAL